MMTIACVIPARLNSSRFPGKLLQRAQGKTVLQHTFEKASQCSSIDEVFVATDDEQIGDHIQSLGGKVIWTSSLPQNGTERICEALQQNAFLQNSSLIVNLQGDHPCTEPATLTALIETLRADEKAVMSTAVTPIRLWADYLSPHVVKCVFDKFHRALYFSRSPIPYTHPHQPWSAYAHIGTYAYKTPFLKKFLDESRTPLQKSEDLEQLQVLENGHRIKIAVVEETILGIDTPQDLEHFKELLCQSNISL